jgi:predicted transcriptional regulator
MKLPPGQEILDVLLANETRADLVSLFRKNPGLIDSLDGVARRIGRSPSVIENDVEQLVKVGVLKTRKLGESQVVSLDRPRDKQIQSEVGEFLQNLKPNSEGRL